MKRLLLLGVFATALRGSVKPEEFGPQVVFVMDHSIDDRRYVVPKATVFFSIVPMEGTHPAPLNHGDYLLCRSHDIHTDKGTFIAFRCGQDDYIVQTVGMKPEKE